MPKKRKASSTQWPPLTFVSSPDSQHPPVLTPDLAVDNPITAKTVFIEELSINAWVSPQFYQLRSQKNKSSIYAVNVNSATGNEFQLLNKSKRHVNETDLQLQKKQNKYKQLKFLKNNKTINLSASTIPCDKIKENSFSLEKSSTRKTGHSSLVSDVPIIEPIALDINTPVMELQDPPLTPLSSGTQRGCQLKALKPHNLFGTMRLENTENTPKDNHCLRETENVGLNNQMSENHDKLSITELLDIKALKSSQRNILVADTPECDYNLTFRQRQLKYGLRKKHDVGL